MVRHEIVTIDSTPNDIFVSRSRNLKIIATVACGAPLWLLLAFASEKKITMADLPPAVRAAATAQTKSVTVTGIKQLDDQGIRYEVETLVNGKTRDLIFDPTGTLVEVEQEVELHSIPAPAKAAIEKQAAGGKVAKVETLTKGQSVTYEALISKGAQKYKVFVRPDGSLVK